MDEHRGARPLSQRPYVGGLGRSRTADTRIFRAQPPLRPVRAKRTQRDLSQQNVLVAGLAAIVDSSWIRLVRGKSWGKFSAVDTNRAGGGMQGLNPRKGRDGADLDPCAAASDTLGVPSGLWPAFVRMHAPGFKEGEGTA